MKDSSLGAVLPLYDFAFAHLMRVNSNLKGKSLMSGSLSSAERQHKRRRTMENAAVRRAWGQSSAELRALLLLIKQY